MSPTLIETWIVGMSSMAPIEKLINSLLSFYTEDLVTIVM